MADGGSGGELDPRRWRALAVCVCALYITLLDVSIVTVALVPIGRDTGAGPAQLQWIISGYALAFGMVPIIGGRLGDDRGRRLMMLIGIASFVVFSAVVGLAPNPAVLVARPGAAGSGRRAAQPAGVRAGAAAVPALGARPGIRADRHRGRGGHRDRPGVGGVILALGGDQWGWRLCFLVNVPIGIGTFLLCRRWVPDPEPRTGPPRPLDLPGAALLAAGVLALLLPAVQFDASHDPRLALLLLPALALLAAFYGWERGPARRRGYPLMDLGPVPDPLVRGRGGPRAAVLLRVHGDAAGAGAVPAGRARVQPAAVRA